MARLTNHLILVHHIGVDSLDIATLTRTSTQTVDSTMEGHHLVVTLITCNGLLQTPEAMTARPQVPEIHLAARLRHQQTITRPLPNSMMAHIRSDQ